MTLEEATSYLPTNLQLKTLAMSQTELCVKPNRACARDDLDAAPETSQAYLTFPGF